MPAKHRQREPTMIMRRCTTCDSYYPNPRCPACQPRIEEEDETENEEQTDTMKTHDHEPLHCREYIPEHGIKTAADIQRDINLMRLAHAYRRNQNQPRRDSMLGWSLAIVGILFPIICILVLIFD